MDVLGLGENSIDDVYRLPLHPRLLSEAKVRISSHRRLPGGQVATTLTACAALGLTAGYLGAFGDDDGGREVRQELTDRGVDVRDAPTRHAPNRHAVILVDERTGERMVLWQRDAALGLRPDEIRPETIGRARLLHLDATDEEMSIHAARLGRAAGIPVTSDIDRITDRTPDLVRAVTIPIFAEGIAAALAGDADDLEALRSLRREHEGWLCVTRGARGALLLDGDRLHEAPAFEVDIVDTTGAGDVFRAGFIYALLRGDPAADVLRFANAAAAVSCTREGAIASVPTLAEVEMLLRDA